MLVKNLLEIQILKYRRGSETRVTGEVNIDIFRAVPIGQTVGKTASLKIAHNGLQLVQNLGDRNPFPGRDNSQRIHIGTEKRYLRIGKFAPIHPRLLGAFEKRIVNIRNVLGVANRKASRHPVPHQGIGAHIGKSVPQVSGIVGRDTAGIEGRLPSFYPADFLIIGIVKVEVRGESQWWYLRACPSLHLVIR